MSRSRAAARSRRRLSTHRCGGAPKAAAKHREKCAGDTPLILAMRPTDHRCSGAAATRRRLEEAGLGHRVQVITALVESALASALPADVVILNPPRMGVDVGVMRQLDHAASQGVRGVVYVSCDPATLARDLARVPGWRIDAVRCFDMFPQTAHVETVCVLRPEIPA